MVGMEMGKKDGLDLLRRHTEGAKVVGQPAEQRPHGVAGTGIDQRPFAGELEQERVHRNMHVVLLAGEPLDLGLVHAEDHVERSGQHAVAERRHRDVADLLAPQVHGASRSWWRR